MKFFKEDISTLFRRMLRYKDNFACLLMYFAPWLGIASAVIIFFENSLSSISVPFNLLYWVTHILSSVIPLIPTIQIWNLRESFDGETGITQGIMDCCFTIWIFVLLFIWI